LCATNLRGKGYGVLTAEKVDINAKLTNVNRLLLNKPKIAFSVVSQRMEENGPKDPNNENIVGRYIKAADTVNFQ